MENRGISKSYIYMILAITMGLIAGCIILNIPLFYGFFLGVCFSMVMLIKKDFKFHELVGMVVGGLKECMAIFIIVLLMGAFISIWLGSGIVPTMIYYGFDYIQQTNYLVACFWIATVISIVMGTALGTISTIGMALLGIGKGLLIPTPILLGAIISGAFIADRVSPIGALVNLTMKTTGVKYTASIKHMAKTLVITFGISTMVYYILGKHYTGEINSNVLQQYQQNISDSFFVSPLLLLFPILIMILAVLGVKIIPNMTIGLVGGIGVSMVLQNTGLNEVIHNVLFGYRANTGMDGLDGILKGGGVVPMVEVILVIIGAVSLSSIFEGTNLIRPLIDQMVGGIKRRGDLIAVTGILSMFLTIATCDQTVGILLIGKNFQKKFNELGINKLTLPRTIADTGTTIAPLIPWNVNAIIIAVVTGTTATDYGPYAVFCYISPAVSILWGYLENRSVGTTKKDKNSYAS